MAGYLQAVPSIPTDLVGVANRARHHEHSLNEIERVDVPFMPLFLLLAGALP